jgi:serine/threonine-protein kinase
MIGEVLVGRYRIDKELGRGGFGETFLARDLHMPKQPLCVVKHLKPVSDNPQLIDIATRLFKKEAETLAELGEHPQIPRLYAYFTEGEDFYLVQEFIDGKDLANEMNKRWTPKQVCNLIVEVMQILEFVHSKGVIHRDIKPQNIIAVRRITNWC